jgi:hypothetical protein
VIRFGRTRTWESTDAFILPAPILDSVKDARQTVLKESCLERGGEKTSPPFFRQGSMAEYRMAHSVDHTCGARVFHRAQRTPYPCMHETMRGAVFCPRRNSFSSTDPSVGRLFASLFCESLHLRPLINFHPREASLILAESHTQYSLRVFLSAIPDPQRVLFGERQMVYKETRP